MLQQLDHARKVAYATPFSFVSLEGTFPLLKSVDPLYTNLKEPSHGSATDRTIAAPQVEPLTSENTLLYSFTREQPIMSKAILLSTAFAFLD